MLILFTDNAFQSFNKSDVSECWKKITLKCTIISLVNHLTKVMMKEHFTDSI